MLSKNLQDNQDVVNPMWSFSTPDFTRLQELIEESNTSKMETLLTLLQLFLPGFSTIYYGQEIALQSLRTNRTRYPLMRWDSSINHGFSSISGPFFFAETIGDADSDFLVFLQFFYILILTYFRVN